MVVRHLLLIISANHPTSVLQGSKEKGGFRFRPGACKKHLELTYIPLFVYNEIYKMMINKLPDLHLTHFPLFDQ